MNWNNTDTRTDFIIARGYTGHEHLDAAGLIHMNGPMYDPFLGRMLSPDPVFQNPFNSQNPNRYSYVLNNPLKYTDPSGYQLRKSEADVWALDSYDRYYFDTYVYLSGGGGGGYSSTRMGEFNPDAGPSYEQYMAQNLYSDTEIYLIYDSNNPDHYLNGIDANFNFEITYFNKNNSIKYNSNYSKYSIFNEVDVAQSNGGMDLNGAGVLRNIGYALSYTAGAIGVAQIGMLQYRSSLSIHSKIGTFSKFISTYSGLSKFSGRLGTAGALVGFGFNINDLSSGEIGVGRFAYRTGSIGAAAGTGFMIGGPWGAAAGTAVGGISTGFEYIYDNYLVPIGNEIQYQMWNFENAIKNGWYPGR